MRKSCLSLILLLVVLLCVGCGREEKPAYPGEVYIYDSLGLLSPEENTQLWQIMHRLTEYGNVAFVTTKVTRGTTDYFAMSQYNRLFGTESGILFIIDMGNRNVFIWTDGYIGSYITRGKARVITDNVAEYATRFQYYTCAAKAFEQAEKVITGGYIPQPMVYASNAVLAVIVGLVLNFLLLRALNRKKEMTSVKELNKFVVGVTRIHSTKRNIVRTKVVHFANSSGGGFRGGGGFGGGGHGHGGGHRF
jgi:uncharacterized protein